MSTLITNIGELTTNVSPRLRDAALVIEGERIAWVGRAADAPAADERIDAAGAAVLPGWIRTPTWCSRATALPSSRRAWRASRTRPAAST